MTQEEKQLLLKDICARLPYGVEIELMPITRGKCVTLTTIILQDYFISDDVNYLPYLRPMSSMTNGEMEEVSNLLSGIVFRKDIIRNQILSVKLHTEALDWLLSHHFDFRYLIEAGLALEAPEGMYK